MGDGSGDTLDVGSLLDIVGGQLPQFLELFNHWWDYKIHNAADYGDRHNECQDDAQRSGQVHMPLHEFYDRVEQVGEEPSDEERQQNAAEVIHKQEDAEYKQSDADPSD